MRHYRFYSVDTKGQTVLADTQVHRDDRLAIAEAKRILACNLQPSIEVWQDTRRVYASRDPATWY